MATLTIKNLPDEMYVLLSKTAKEHRRSINSEAIVSLERGLADANANTETVLQQIRANREAMKKKGVWLTDEILEQAKNEGRS